MLYKQGHFHEMVYDMRSYPFQLAISLLPNWNTSQNLECSMFIYVLDFTPWYNCSTIHHINFFEMYSTILHIMHKDYLHT